MSVFNNLFNKKKLSHMIEEIKEEIHPEKATEAEDEEDEEAEILTEEKAEPRTDEMLSEEEYPIVEREIHPAKIVCPDCGGITLEGLEFCDKCGGEL